MPKSKEFISDSESDSGSDVEPKPKKKKAEKVKTEDEPPKKKAEKVETEDEPPKKKTTKGPNGETMIELSNMKFATVGTFKGKIIIGIREFYDKDGQLMPGRKGIALNPEQWKKLKESIDDVDAAIKEKS